MLLVLRRGTMLVPGRLIFGIARAAQTAWLVSGCFSDGWQNKTPPRAFRIGRQLFSPTANAGRDPECPNS